MEKYAAIYIRVSTDYQAEEGYSIDAQKEQLTAYCVSKGWKNYQYYIDGGWSGSNINRPEITKLIQDCEAGKVSAVLVYKLDRLSRSQKDTLYLIEDVFNVHNVSFISITESLDTGTPMGRLMIGILSAFAQLERENIRMRTRMGMKERVKDGYWMGGGRVPFGYDYDKNLGVLVPNKDADTVRNIYKLYIQGESPQKIANMLNLKYDKLVNQIIKRKSNYGMIEYNGEVYQGRHEPLISKEMYDTAMEQMSLRSKTPDVQSNYLLTGMLYCGHCGAKMRYQKWGDKTKIVCYSQQKSKKYLIKDENCPQAKVLSTDVDSAIENLLFKIKEDPNQTGVDIYINKEELLKKQYKEIENKIRRLYNLYASAEDEILLEEIDKNKKALNNIKESLEKNKEQQRVNNSNKKLIGLKDKWEYLTDNQKHNICKTLIEKVTITDDTVEIKLTF